MSKKKRMPPLKTNKYREELWFPLVGHEELYKISDHGRLKQIRTFNGQPCNIIQKGMKMRRKGRRERIVQVVSPKTGRVNMLPLRFLMEQTFFERKWVKPIDGDYTNLKLSNLTPIDKEVSDDQI